MHRRELSARAGVSAAIPSELGTTGAGSLDPGRTARIKARHTPSRESIQTVGCLVNV
jgi:hypothetical protein